MTTEAPDRDRFASCRCDACQEVRRLRDLVDDLDLRLDDAEVENERLRAAVRYYVPEFGRQALRERGT